METNKFKIKNGKDEVFYEKEKWAKYIELLSKEKSIEEDIFQLQLDIHNKLERSNKLFIMAQKKETKQQKTETTKSVNAEIKMPLPKLVTEKKPASWWVLLVGNILQVIYHAITGN